MQQAVMAESLVVRPPLRVLVLYALGQFGWSLSSYGVSNLLTYFYMPPETGEGFPTYIFQGTVLGLFTLIGLISAAGRLFDALLDPLVANWSDRSNARVGKRRFFMLIGALPFAFSAFMVFLPPSGQENAGNFMWLACWLALYYFFFTVYVIPYSALIAELGHDERAHMLISTLLSTTWALGFIAGNSTLAIQSFLEQRGIASAQAFQWAAGGLNALALLFMLLPAVFLNERRYARQQTSEYSLLEALRGVWKNTQYRLFLGSDLLYWLALNFIQIGMAYYTTLLLGLDKAYVFGFSLVSFFASFVFYIPVNMLARRVGKKRLLQAAFLLFAVLFAVVAFFRAVPLPKLVLLYSMGVLAAFPLAIFSILPNALIADELERARQSGLQPLAGMYYGLRAFVMKLGISLSNLFFPSLLLLGKSLENPLGVQATAWVALLFCLGGWVVFRRYREFQRVQAAD